LQLESLGTSLGDLKSDFGDLKSKVGDLEKNLTSKVGDLSLGQKEISVRLASVERMQGALYENELRREVAK
jgi:hypothetical protein